nr:GNAT family N-acetyltransferase [Angustibacter aerolatus]
MQTTEQDLLEHLFPADPAQARVHALVAEVDDGSGPRVEGMAIWYVTFSTWVGRHGLWLEDLYVTPDRRGSGLGKALLQEPGPHRGRARLRAGRVVGARLERAVHRVLPPAGGRRPGRVDDVPARRRRPVCPGHPLT